MGLGGWWADGPCVGRFFFFCYAVSRFCDQRRARMMVTGLEGSLASWIKTHVDKEGIYRLGLAWACSRSH